MVKKDLTPTVVLKRPVDPYCEIGSVFSKLSPFISFICSPLSDVYAPADAIVAKTSRGKLILYCELPNATIKLTFSGLKNVLTRQGFHVKEGERVGLTSSKPLVMEIIRLPEGEPAQAEFFAERSDSSF